MPVRSRSAAVEAIRGGLVVSCQAPPGHPLRQPNMIALLAECAHAGGAVGVRLDGPGDVRVVRASVDVPIIGIRKKFRVGGRPLITPRYGDCADLAAVGADIVAVEATAESPGRANFAALVDRVHEELGVAIMADISTYDEGLAAWEAGADLIGTTLVGYTHHSPARSDPDLELAGKLAGAGLRVVLEGRVHTPEQAAAALDLGTWAVVVGKAITDPLATTQRFVAALSGEVAAAEQ